MRQDSKPADRRGAWMGGIRYGLSDARKMQAQVPRGIGAQP